MSRWTLGTKQASDVNRYTRGGSVPAMIATRTESGNGRLRRKSGARWMKTEPTRSAIPTLRKEAQGLDGPLLGNRATTHSASSAPASMTASVKTCAETSMSHSSAEPDAGFSAISRAGVDLEGLRAAARRTSEVALFLF